MTECKTQLFHLQVMFEDNGGGAGGPLDNLTEDDIVLLDGDYDEVRESVVIILTFEILFLPV